MIRSILKPFSTLWRQETAWFLVMLGGMLWVTFPVLLLFHANWFGDRVIATQAFSGKVQLNNMLLYAHVLLAIPPLVIGPWLFLEEFRKSKPRWHRELGKAYVLCCMFSALTGLPLALGNAVGIIPRMGFSSLAVCWFLFTYIAYRSARNRDFQNHRKWMMRSYACTFAFVNVKFYGLAVLSFGLEPGIWLMRTMQSCVSWMSNLFIVEIYLAGTIFTGTYAGKKIFLRNLSSLPLKVIIFLSLFLSVCLLSATFFPIS